MTQAPVMEALPQTEALHLLSVTTTIQEALGYGRGMLSWKDRFAGETAVDGHQVIGAMLAKGEREAAISYIKEASNRYAREAADRGTRTHAALEALTLGQAPRLDDEIEPYVRQYGRWLDRFQPEFMMVEAPVYHPEMRYAGTTDGVMKLDGMALSFDYKTTAHPPEKESRPPYPEVALQLCAYARAKEVGVLSEQRYSDRGKRFYIYDPTQAHEPMPEVDRNWALAIIISPFDCRAVPTRIDEEVWVAWRHAQAVARFRMEVARSLFQVPWEAPPLQSEEE